jgi:hypothetical protein
MKHLVKRLLVMMGLFLGAMAGPAFGQASESEMRTFPMPPVKAYVAEHNFDDANYAYRVYPPSANPGTGSSAGDYDYFRYTGLSGREVYLYGTWGYTPIPDPQGQADACAHAHSSYGVWGRYEIQIFRGYQISGWAFLGGGGKSGVRNAQGRCVFSVNNPLSSIDPRYGWGQDLLSFDFRGSMSIYKELVLAVQSNTHGWGSCSVPPQTFKACIEPSWAIAYAFW